MPTLPEAYQASQGACLTSTQHTLRSQTIDACARIEAHIAAKQRRRLEAADITIQLLTDALGEAVHRGMAAERMLGREHALRCSAELRLKQLAGFADWRNVDAEDEATEVQPCR